MSERLHLGIDVGGTSVRLLGERLDGPRGEIVRAPTPGTYDEFLALVATLAPRAVAGPVVAAGCGVPGKVEDGVPRFVPALPWLEGRSLAADLGEVLDAPVELAVDGHVALLGEATEGAARDCDSAVLVAVGTGIGGAIMIDRRIWTGAHGSAGSWGWLPAEGAVEDPGHGPWEQVASGSALAARAAAFAPPLAAHELVERARGGDPVAATEIEAFARRLGRGIAAIASILDPEVVLLAGGLSSAVDLLEPGIAACLRDLGSPDARRVPVRVAELGPDAGVVGALVHARHREGALL